MSDNILFHYNFVLLLLYWTVNPHIYFILRIGIMVRVQTVLASTTKVTIEALSLLLTHIFQLNSDRAAVVKRLAEYPIIIFVTLFPFCIPNRLSPNK